MGSLFGLAPGGVYPATRVTTRAVRSYRTFSPLPPARAGSAVCFLWHFPWARAPQALPGTLSCGARTFLPAANATERLPGRLLRNAIMVPKPPAYKRRRPNAFSGAAFSGAALQRGCLQRGCLTAGLPYSGAALQRGCASAVRRRALHSQPVELLPGPAEDPGCYFRCAGGRQLFE